MTTHAYKKRWVICLKTDFFHFNLMYFRNNKDINMHVITLFSSLKFNILRLCSLVPVFLELLIVFVIGHTDCGFSSLRKRVRSLYMYVKYLLIYILTFNHIMAENYINVLMNHSLNIMRWYFRLGNDQIHH